MDTRKKKVKPWLRREKIYVPNSDSDSDSEPTSKTLREYGNATTVHGIPYILEAGRNPVERLLWIIFVGHLDKFIFINLISTQLKMSLIL